MNRIDATFARLRVAGRTGLIPYVTAGDPSPDTTVPILHALVAAGADAIELGVPFSDPMADGPVIQRASERALAQGVGLDDVIDMVATFRSDNAATPIVLMGYANPIEAMGTATFADRAQRSGVDGVIVVDYPPEEAGEFAALLDARGIAPIFLLSPTTPEARMTAVGRMARGYTRSRRPGRQESGVKPSSRGDHDLVAKTPAAADQVHAGRHQEIDARRAMGQVPGVRDRPLPHRSREESQCLSEVRPSRPLERARAHRPVARSGGPLRNRLGGRPDRQPQVQGHEKIFGASLGGARGNGRDRRAGCHAGQYQVGAAGDGCIRVRLHGRLDGLGRG